jgi:hypothetical protein
MAEGHEHDAALSHQRCEDRHSAPTLFLIQMHPDRRQHRNIECLAPRAEKPQVRKTVVEPFDLR